MSDLWLGTIIGSVLSGFLTWFIFMLGATRLVQRVVDQGYFVFRGVVYRVSTHRRN